MFRCWSGGVAERAPLLPMDQLRLLREEPVRVGVRDLGNMVRWYEEKLGFVQIGGAQMKASGTEIARVVMLYGPNLIELVVSDHPHSNPRSRANELLVEDVDAVTIELKERGVEVLEEPRFARRRDLRVAKIRDPEGHSIELQQLL